MAEGYSPSQVNDDDEDNDELEMNANMGGEAATEDEKLDQVLDEGHEEEGEGEQEEEENNEDVEGPHPNPHFTDYDQNQVALDMSVPPHMTTTEKCELCDVAHSSEEAANEHYESGEHAEKVNDYLKSVYSEASDDSKRGNGTAIDDESDIPSVRVEITDEFIQKYKYACTYCGLCFQEFEHMFRHEKGPMHAIRVWEYQQQVGGYNTGSPSKRSRKPEWPEGFYCSICDTDLTSAEDYQNHLITEQHETRAQRLVDTGTPMGNGEADGGRGGYRGGWRGGPMRGGGGPWRGPVPLNMMGPMGGGYGPGPGGPWMRGRGGPRFRPYDFGPRGGFRGGPRGFGGPRGPFRPMGPMRGGRGGGPYPYFNNRGGPQGGGYMRPQGDQSQQAQHGYTMGTGGYAAQQQAQPQTDPASAFAMQQPAAAVPQTTDDQSQASTGPKPWWNLNL